MGAVLRDKVLGPRARAGVLGKASQKCLLLKDMEPGGGAEVMVGLVPAGAAVVVTVPDSTALRPAGTGSGDRCISREGEKKCILGINCSGKGLVESGLCSKVGLGEKQCIFLHWAGSFYSDLCYLPESVDWKTESTEGKRT